MIGRNTMAEGDTTINETIKLLIIDDEEGFVSVLSKRMGKRGIQVTETHSGTEAIQILRKQDFDVALLDLKMEDMGGIEVLKIFKKMVPDMPVIMLTGHGCKEAAIDGMTVGAADYLTKPCALDELIIKIQDAVKNKG